MMTFTLEGKLIEKWDEVQITETFKKREFVVETTESNAGREFVEQIKFQILQDKCEMLENYNLNDQVKVSFSIKGRKWEKDGRGGYFVNLDAWRIEPVDTDTSEATDDDFESSFEDNIDDVPF